MLPYPEIDPVAIALGPLKIHWYGLAYLAGLAFAWWLAVRRSARPDSPVAREQVDDLIFFSALITGLSIDQGTGRATLTFTGQPGHVYSLQAGTDLNSFPTPVPTTSGSTVPNGEGNGSLEFDFSPGTLFLRLNN